MAIAFLWAFAQTKWAQAQQVRREEPDAGSIIEFVILAAVAVVACGAIGVIVYGKIRDKANGIDTTTPGALP